MTAAQSEDADVAAAQAVSMSDYRQRQSATAAFINAPDTAPRGSGDVLMPSQSQPGFTGGIFGVGSHPAAGPPAVGQPVAYLPEGSGKQVAPDVAPVPR